MSREEASDMVFKDFTAILAKHNVNREDAEFLTATFGDKWHFLPEQLLEPMKELLHKISLAKYFEKEQKIKALCLRATEGLRLLISLDVYAFDS